MRSIMSSLLDLRETAEPKAPGCRRNHDSIIAQLETLRATALDVEIILCIFEAQN